jgi:hypothetical protein
MADRRSLRRTNRNIPDLLIRQQVGINTRLIIVTVSNAVAHPEQEDGRSKKKGTQINNLIGSFNMKTFKSPYISNDQHEIYEKGKERTCQVAYA